MMAPDPYSPMPVLVVERALPVESALALARFTSLNSHWRGAAWADCLDALADSDSHLDVTEPIWDALEAERPVTDQERPYVSLVAITLLYAHADEQRIPSPFDVRGKLDAVLGCLDSGSFPGSEPE